ncbi:MAG: DNA repair exonuclease [Planctomycetota bacterium]
MTGTQETRPRRILHAADIHLDSPLQKLDRYDGAPAERIRRASRLALEQMMQLAIEQQVDLVVIAGDLYDGDWPDQNTGLAFVRQAARLIDAGIPLVVIRGNHDAANQMTRSLPLPKNPDGSEIFLSARQPESRVFESMGVAVHGQSFRTRAETSNLAAKYPMPIQGMFNLGLLHTGLEGASEHAHYAPCTPAQLTDLGYDYWALGHIHTRRDHAITGGPPIVFSGNLQGRHVGEPGAKGCLIVDIDTRNQCEYQFQAVDVLRFLTMDLDVSALQHVDEILDAYSQWLADQTAAAEGRLLVVRVRLFGATSLHHQLHQRREPLRADLQAIAMSAAAGEAWLEDVRVATDPPKSGSDLTPEELAGPLASIRHVIDQWQSESFDLGLLENELTGIAKKLPRELKGSIGDASLTFDDPEWVRELIESAASEVLGRLQEDAS